MNESFKKIIDEYKTVPPAKKLLINALKEIKPDKKNWGVWVYSGILALVLSIGIGFHEETVEVFRNVIEIFLTIQIAVFGVLFTVYSILLSFLNNDFMKLLANSPESDGKSQLRVCTEYFESVLFLYFMSILLSLSILIAMKCIPDDYRLTENFVFDCVLASILICVFLVFSLRVNWLVRRSACSNIKRNRMLPAISSFPDGFRFCRIWMDTICWTDCKRR